MTRTANLAVLVAALAAAPVLAADPVPGSDRDPFSQTYAGPDLAAARAERAREVEREVERQVRDRDAKARDAATPAACACGHGARE